MISSTTIQINSVFRKMDPCNTLIKHIGQFFKPFNFNIKTLHQTSQPTFKLLSLCMDTALETSSSFAD